MDEVSVAEKVGDVITSMSKALGIKNLPQGDDAKKMMRFVQFQYGELFPGEVELAFFIVLNNTPSDQLKHYGELSIRFLQFVMNQYVKNRSAVIRAMGQAAANPQTSDGQPSAKKLKQIAWDSVEVVMMLFVKYKLSGDITKGNISNRFAWDTLVKMGMTDIEQKLVDDYTAKAPDIAKEYKSMEQGGIGAYLNALQKLTVDDLDTQIALKDLLLREQFRRYVASGIDLKEALHARI